MNLFEPWILLRLVAAFVTAVLFLRALVPAVKVLRHYDLRAATEGQLALERQLLLSTTLLRIALLLQVVGVVVAVLSAEKLAPQIRGAMCGYGVFASNAWGFPSLFVSSGLALVSGVAAQLMSFDATQKRTQFVRAMSWLMIGLAPLSVLDAALAFQFARKLDLTVIASCCSVELDAGGAAATEPLAASGSRNLLSFGPPVLMVLALALAVVAWRRPGAKNAAAAGVVSLVALPISVGYAVLEVAPHVFETPTHVCPFCLLKADVYGIGYPLFGSLYFAFVWSMGAWLSTALSKRSDSPTEALGLARRLFRGESIAWAIALLTSLWPTVRYAWVTGGLSLWH